MNSSEMPSPPRETAESVEARSRKEALANLPFLFDTDRFVDLSNRLEKLQRAGVTDVTAGAHTYTVEEMQNTVTAFSDYSRSMRESRKPIVPEELETFLANQGITRDKISAGSAQGFRECLKECVINDDRAVQLRPQR